jgi:hypothetical protein
VNPSLNDLGLLAMGFVGFTAGVVWHWTVRKDLAEETVRLRRLNRLLVSRLEEMTAARDAVVADIRQLRTVPRLRVVGGDTSEVTRAANMRRHPSWPRQDGA